MTWETASKFQRWRKSHEASRSHPGIISGDAHVVAEDIVSYDAHPSRKLARHLEDNW
jgi:heme-degrading monooxygenase HmoA